MKKPKAKKTNKLVVVKCGDCGREIIPLTVTTEENAHGHKCDRCSIGGRYA